MGLAAEAQPGRRRRLAPADRREELLDAAVELLRADESPGNWVEAVTRRAGAAKGTFYRYFAAWEDMLAAVRGRLVAESSEPIRDALASPGAVDWWAVLDAQCARFLDVAVRNGPHHALVFHSGSPVGLDGSPGPGPALLAAAIDRGALEGSFRAVDAEATAVLLLAAVHAAADAVLAGGDRARWSAACAALARGALTPGVAA